VYGQAIQAQQWPTCDYGLHQTRKKTSNSCNNNPHTLIGGAYVFAERKAAVLRDLRRRLLVSSFCFSQWWLFFLFHPSSTARWAVI